MTTKIVVYAIGAQIAKAEAVAAALRSVSIEVRDGARFSAAADQVEEGLAIDKAFVLCIDKDSLTAGETALFAAVDAVYTSSIKNEILGTNNYFATAALMVQAAIKDDLP